MYGKQEETLKMYTEGSIILITRLKWIQPAEVSFSVT